jgi:acyl carrier protein
MDTIQSLREIFESELALKLDGFGPRTTAADIEQWDSTAHVSLVLAIETRFAIEFTPAELGKLNSVAAIRDIIEAKLAA